MSETELQKSIRLAIGTHPDVRLFRNNVGNGWMADETIGHRGTRSQRIVLLNPRRVQFGLCPGSSDLIGWRSVTISEAHVGLRLAVFTSMEIKRPGEIVPVHQLTWLMRVRQAGGLAGTACSVADARQMLGVGS